jgi:hypothetical protein
VVDLLCKSRLNLSQHKSLRALRLDAYYLPTDPINGARALQSINALLSTIPSSSRLDVFVIYRGSDFFHGGLTPSPGHEGYVGDSIAKSGCDCYQCIRNLDRLKMLGEAHRIRNFRLVLCVEAPGKAKEYIMRALELQVGALQDGELGSLLSGSSIISAVPCFASGYM